MSNSDKDKIVKCAKDIIAEGGVKNLSVSKIAAQCKMSKSTFYKNFSSKRELMMHLSIASTIFIHKKFSIGV